MSNKLTNNPVNAQNIEPVAWIDKVTGKPRMDGWIQTNYDIPLYTHPADLTDEEIIDIADTYDWHKDCAIDFARAILRKAQEK